MRRLSTTNSTSSSATGSSPKTMLKGSPKMQPGQGSPKRCQNDLGINVQNDDEIEVMIQDAFDRIFINVPRLSLQIADIIEKEIPTLEKNALENVQRFRFRFKTVDMKKYPIGKQPLTPEEAAMPVNISMFELSQTCIKHLIDKEHVCCSGENYLQDVELLPHGVVEADRDLELFLERCKRLHNDLQQNMLKIQNAMIMLFPKREGTETNLGLDVLRSVVNASNMETWTVSSFVHKHRAQFFIDSSREAHFEYNENSFIEFYLQVLHEVETVLWNFLHNAAYMHSTLIKNMDHMLKMQEQQFNKASSSESIAHFYS